MEKITKSELWWTLPADHINKYYKRMEAEFYLDNAEEIKDQIMAEYYYIKNPYTKSLRYKLQELKQWMSNLF